MVLAGKEVVHKTDVAEQKLNVLEEARVAGRVKQAAASALAAVAVKAKLLADQEEREMQRLIAVVIDQQVFHKPFLLWCIRTERMFDLCALSKQLAYILQGVVQDLSL